MTIEEYWDDMTASDKQVFQRTCRSLLKQTFAVRDKDDDSRRLYNFIARNESFFSDYFRYMGFTIQVDRENGVAMLQNYSEHDTDVVKTNHLRLRKVDSIILCALWTLYTDRLRSGSLSRTYQITIADLSFTLEKYGYQGNLDKTTLSGSLNLLSRYNLIHVEGQIGDVDCVIVLYPSLQFALDKESFKQLAQAAQERMRATHQEDIGELETEDDDTEEE